jgi:hypothetical protein
MRPEVASPHWAGLPEPEVAAPIAIARYLGAYGPASADAFGNWLAGGWFGKRQLHSWFGELGELVAVVDVDGEPAYVLSEHVDELAASKPTAAVRLLPGFDQYVLGPGTADGHIVPSARRWEVSKQSGWIAPVVLAGGVVAGTWALDGEDVRIDWFAESGKPPRRLLNEEVARLSATLGRDLRATISLR